MAYLQITGLSVNFGGVRALSDVAFSVAEGSIVSLIGPNGAGKTTAFNVITGYLAPTAGTVRFAGESIAGLRPHEVARRGLVRTFQKTNIFPELTVGENVLTGLHLKGSAGLGAILLNRVSVRAEEARLRERAEEVLAFVGIAHRRDESASSLPYGEQRLLEVAIGLAADPRMLLLDEPASGMNPSEKESMMGLIGRIRQKGITVFLVEHDMRLVMGISERVVVLNQGQIIAEGSPDEVRGNRAVIEAYLGTQGESLATSSANRAPA
ncbi:MAG: ABC transporter ATP-binding protein [Burkholderiales bacterium]|nr:ABC transporter ATP-binding protein [Burkholderiales bacterium]